MVSRNQTGPKSNWAERTGWTQLEVGPVGLVEDQGPSRGRGLGSSTRGWSFKHLLESIHVNVGESGWPQPERRQLGDA